MDIHEHLGNVVAKWTGFIGGTGTWFVLSDSPLGLTPKQQLALLGAKAVFSLFTAIACGFGSKWGVDLYNDLKQRNKNKTKWQT